MKVKDCMSVSPAHCGLDASVADAAHLMWVRDCGFVPVVDFATGCVVGVVTDRDVCMGAYTQGLALAQISVASVMTRVVASALPDDDLARATDLMAKRQVRRLPVIDSQGALVGVLSMNDVARVAAEGKGAGQSVIRPRVLAALTSIGRARHIMAREEAPAALVTRVLS